MFRKEKCRRRNAGTRTAVFKPQLQEPSYSTTLTPRQGPLFPPPCQRALYSLIRPYPFLQDRHPSIEDPVSYS